MRFTTFLKKVFIGVRKTPRTMEDIDRTVASFAGMTLAEVEEALNISRPAVILALKRRDRRRRKIDHFLGIA